MIILSVSANISILSAYATYNQGFNLQKSPLSIDHVDCNLQSSSWAPGRIYYILPYGTKINRGDCIHVYAFHADTLKKYSWEEIRTGKKYWFRETVCQSTDIQFPDGFKYMEESDAENP